MAKKGYVDVIGITRGKEPEVLATFEDRKDANWHVKNTFVEEDKCLVKSTTKKGSKFIKNDVASDRDSYIKSVAEMAITDLESLKITTEESTLLKFLLDGVVDKKTDLNKLVELDVDEEGIERIQVIHSENTVFPHSKVKKKLEDTLIKNLVGEDESEREEETEDEEESESEETTEDEEVESEEDESEEESEEDSEEEPEEEETEDDSEEDSEDEEENEEESEDDEETEEDDDEDSEEEEIEEEEVEETDTEEDEDEEDDDYDLTDEDLDELADMDED